MSLALANHVHEGAGACGDTRRTLSRNGIGMAKVEDYRRLDESEIVKMVEDNIKASVGYYDSELSRERKKVTDYYNAAPAGTRWKLKVCFKMCTMLQSMKAALLETSSATASSASHCKAQRTYRQPRYAAHTLIMSSSVRMTVTACSKMSSMTALQHVSAQPRSSGKKAPR